MKKPKSGGHAAKPMMGKAGSTLSQKPGKGKGGKTMKGKKGCC